jgi:hypothetical protein
MAAWSRLLLLLPALGLLPGCATVALNAALRATNPGPAWNGEVAVASEPAGAACRVLRGERVLAEVAATPGSVRLERSHDVLELRCRAEGHVETVQLLRPADDPAVFRMAPNGIIGLAATAVSLATASTMRYPGAVTVPLAPARFASEAEREAWFAGRRAAIIAARADSIALAEERCRAQPDGGCDTEGQVIRREQEEDLARLEALRPATEVAPRLARAE